MAVSARRRILGWYSYEWASQPYNTLLMTFIFGPYVVSVLGDGTQAQAVWGYGIAAAGILIALAAPWLGAVADRAGGRMPFIRVFALLYVVGAAGLWWSSPQDFNVWFVMAMFGIGLIGLEAATTFINALMPTLGERDRLGRISGTGWAVGYVGGVVALVLVLALFAEGAGGTTLIGIAPILGLDPETREGTRAVGPITAIWFALFMIPFFLWVREVRDPAAIGYRQAVREAWPELRSTLRGLPRQTSLFAYLGSSMFYRDGLNGMFVFGGIYAAGVLGWTVVQVGVFGIVAAIVGAVFCWIGGRADSRYGPKPVIAFCVLALAGIALAVVFIGRDSLFGVPVAPGSALPDIAFYVIGAGIGAAGGTLQAASRTMLVRQADPAKITESFGLYALAGKAGSFVAPLSIALVTDLTGSQQLGITPLIVLFLIGFVLLVWVNPDGERAAWSEPQTAPSR